MNVICYNYKIGYSNKVIQVIYIINELEEFEMKISYKKLWVHLAHKEIPKAQLRKDLGMASSTLTKLNKNEIVALSILIRICEYLKCDIGDIMEVTDDVEITNRYI